MLHIKKKKQAESGHNWLTSHWFKRSNITKTDNSIYST